MVRPPPPFISEEAMSTIYRAAYVSLHVRRSNRAALSLYRDTLGFTVKDIEKKYCESARTPSLRTGNAFILTSLLRRRGRRGRVRDEVIPYPIIGLEKCPLLPMFYIR